MSEKLTVRTRTGAESSISTPTYNYSNLATMVKRPTRAHFDTRKYAMPLNDAAEETGNDPPEPP
ncbi:hypothetical protein F2Q69_00047331 [Brassica cretica]|uniref:Uncharacterized protein n=1 Tax=Brassica cretica TaxID=69181 RepID=A0A8S9PYP7_BRACR|nr:hypothetical protein F2Q69_00047331 [Brassica cretica]